MSVLIAGMLSLPVRPRRAQPRCRHRFGSNPGRIPGGCTRWGMEPLEPLVLLADSALDAPRNFAVGPLPCQAIPMDLDGDGDLDMAVRGADPWAGPQLQMLENDGAGVFSLRSTIPLPGPGFQLEPADLDGDGRTDLALAYPVQVVAGELVILRQNGAFTFSTQTIALPFPPSCLCAGNLDGINELDFVMGDNLGGRSVYSYLSDGAGSFTFGREYLTESAERDVEPDGDLDLNEQVRAIVCQLGDLNGDGLQDLVVINSIERRITRSAGDWKYVDLHNVVALFNQGAGVLGSYQVIADPYSLEGLITIDQDLAIGDMDGDGDRDLLILGSLAASVDVHEVLEFRNTGNGTFTAPLRFRTGCGTEFTHDIVLADVDGDLDLDAGVRLEGPLSGNVNDELVDRWVLLRNDGAGGLATTEYYPSGARIWDLAFADVDGSAGLDAITVAQEDERVTVYYNQSGRFPVPQGIGVDDPDAINEGTTPADIAAGDFDGDGRLDLAVINQIVAMVGDGPDSLALLRGVPGGISTAPVLVDLPAGPMRLLAGQFAGSSDADLAIVYLGDTIPAAPEGISLSLGVPGGLPGSALFTRLNGMPTDLAALDVNGDGTRDLAAIRIRREGLTAGIAVLAVSNDGTTAYLGDLVLGSDDVLAGDVRMPLVLTSADMNGDGLEDLIAVTQNSLGSRHSIVSVILNHGNLSFTLAGEYLTAPRAASDVTTADVTGDGLADVVLTTQASREDLDPDGSLEILPNLGGGTLGQSVSYHVGRAPARVVAVEIDGRAGLDLAVACDGSNEVTVLHNDGQGGFALQERFLSGGGADALAAGDFDGDGDVDLAVANHEDTLLIPGHHGSVTLLKNRRIRVIPPALVAGGTPLQYAENAPGQSVDPGLLLTAGNTDLTGGRIWISRNYRPGEDVLGFAGQKGIGGSFDPATGALTLTGEASVSAYQAALRSITYRNTSDNPTLLPRTVSFVVSDGTQESNVVTVTIDVAAVNDAPTIGAVSGGAITQGREYTLTAAGVSDPDSAIAKVEFRLDSNGNGLFDEADDALLGTAVRAGDSSWSWTGLADTLPVGEVRFFALAYDEQARSAPATLLVTVVALTLQGGAGNDTYHLRFDPGTSRIQIFDNIPPTSPPTCQIAPSVSGSITIHGGDGDDQVTIDSTAGQIATGIAFAGGDGIDTCAIVGGGFVFNGDMRSAFEDLVLAQGARVTSHGSQHLRMLRIGEDCSLSLSSGGEKVLRASALAVAGNGRLDLADHDLILDVDPSAKQAMLEALSGLIASALHADPAWSGSGLTSSSAQAKPLMTLAIMLNDRGDGRSIRASFAGEAVDANAILVKYTRNGDADLNGAVDADDYYRIDRGLLRGQSGYQNGDFDYNGIIDADDYHLIDAAFQDQNGLRDMDSSAARKPAARAAFLRARPGHGQKGLTRRDLPSGLGPVRRMNLLTGRSVHQTLP